MLLWKLEVTHEVCSLLKAGCVPAKSELNHPLYLLRCGVYDKSDRGCKSNSKTFCVILTDNFRHINVTFIPEYPIGRNVVVGARFIGRLTVNNRPINRAPTMNERPNGLSGFMVIGYIPESGFHLRYLSGPGPETVLHIPDTLFHVQTHRTNPGRCGRFP